MEYDEISFEFFSQNFKGLPHLVFYCFYGDIHFFGNFLIGHFLKPAQLKNGFAPRRQSVNGYRDPIL